MVIEDGLLLALFNVLLAPEYGANQIPDSTASIADTNALACAATLSTGRRKSLAGKGAA